MMKRVSRSVTASALLVVMALLASSPSTGAARKPIQLDEATMIVEVNDTEGDAGFQVFLDGEPWRSMTITDPDGGRIISIKTKEQLRNHGMTELFSESSEPPFSELPLKKFKKIFPEGRYKFDGMTIEGRRLVGNARLSHDIPDGPNITSPAKDSTVPKDGVVASWEPVPETGGINVSGYRAIVEREDPLRVFSADLPASVTSVTIPEEFLESGTEYLLELQVIEASGNITFTEHHFKVS